MKYILVKAVKGKDCKPHTHLHRTSVVEVEQALGERVFNNLNDAFTSCQAYNNYHKCGCMAKVKEIE